MFEKFKNKKNIKKKKQHQQIKKNRHTYRSKILKKKMINRIKLNLFELGEEYCFKMFFIFLCYYIYNNVKINYI